MDDLSSFSILTPEAKTIRIKRLLPSIKSPGRFFIPDDIFYLPPENNTGLNAQAKELARWLGFKPLGLNISFSKNIAEKSRLEASEKGIDLLINGRLRHNAFACAALLSEGLLEYYFVHRKKIKIKEHCELSDVIMLAVVYSGLGIVALNYADSYFEQCYPKLHFLLPWSKHEQARQLQYAGLIKSYAAEYGLEVGAFHKYLCPWAVLKLTPKGQDRPALITYAKVAYKRSRQAYLALFTSTLVVLGGLFMSLYIIGQRPDSLSLSMRQLKEDIDVLNNNYAACMSAVNRKQQSYKQPDIFIEQALAADKNRCTSIRNLYNYKVDQYNRALKN